MKFVNAIIAASVVSTSFMTARPVSAYSVCNELKGASVVAQDGTYLGKLDSAYSTDSIFNDYGIYGNKYSSNSIWNEYGQYGGKYSMNSPFNKYSSTPPVIYTTNNKTANLTINKTFRTRSILMPLVHVSK